MIQMADGRRAYHEKSRSVSDLGYDVATIFVEECFIRVNNMLVGGKGHRQARYTLDERGFVHKIEIVLETSKVIVNVEVVDGKLVFGWQPTLQRIIGHVRARYGEVTISKPKISLDCTGRVCAPLVRIVACLAVAKRGR